MASFCLSGGNKPDWKKIWAPIFFFQKNTKAELLQLKLIHLFARELFLMK